MNRFAGQIDSGGLTSRPAPTCCGNLQVLWHGGISNRAALVAEANRRGEHLVDPDDGELLARACAWWKEQLAAHVDGQYAVAVYDPAERKLFLSHDPLGLACVYYSDTSGQFLFSSHLDELDRSSSLDDLDEEYLADYLMNCTFVGARTPFRSVRRLEAGQSLTYQNGRLQLCRTWTLSAVKPLRLADSVESAHRFRDLLSESVRGAADARGPVWSELSGGLDSSSVTTVAAHLGTPNLAAFSLVFPRHRQSDETEWIREVLDRYPLPWHTLDGDAALPYSRLPERACSEPRFSMINWGWWRRREELLHANGVSVLLTGQGGDLVCLGPGTAPYHLADWSHWLRPWQALAEVRKWQNSDPQQRSLLFWMSRNVIGPLLRHTMRRPVSRSDRSWPSTWFHPQFVRRVGLDRRIQQFPITRCSSVGRQWFWERVASMSAQIAAENQLSHGYELRHPFMDRALIEFVSAIPWHEKLHPGIDRFLQRRALAGILPERIRQRTSKVTFDEPTFEGLRQSRAWAEALTRDPRIVQLGLVDGKEWSIAVSQARMGRVQNLPQFVAAATLEVWLRQLETGAGRRPGTGPGA